MIRKCLFPAAGYGTRFLPATKAMPKEMLPIIDKPVIQYIVEEAAASGITDVILVTSYTKRPVEDHFDDAPVLENWLQSQGKERALEEIRSISKLANFVYLRQKGPYGSATPIMNARHVIGDEPFAVLFGDDVFLSKRPRLRQLLDVFERYGDPVLTAIKTDDEGTKKYGVIDPGPEVAPGVFEIKSVVEKPGPEAAPSRLASVGGYILTPDIFEAIERLKPGVGGEYILLDAISAIGKTRPIYACEIEGEYHDTGSKIGWLKANLAFALTRDDLGKQTQDMIKSLR